MTQFVQNKQWKDTAIERSVVITDAWETTLVYAGRFAEPILYICMVIDIIQILPSVTLPVALTSGTLATQAISLDIAGLSLASMADNAKANGNTEAAHRARITGWFLIGLMIATVLFVTMGQLYPQIKPFTDASEKILILLRVVMTIVYATVIHGLRRVNTSAPPTIIENLQGQIERLQREHEGILQRVETEIRDRLALLEKQQQHDLDQAMEEVTKRLQENVTVPVTDATQNVTNVTISTSSNMSNIPVTHNELLSVKPDASMLLSVTEADRVAIVTAFKSGVKKRDMCRHLGWGTGKYKIVTAVLASVPDVTISPTSNTVTSE